LVKKTLNVRKHAVRMTINLQNCYSVAFRTWRCFSSWQCQNRHLL